jgi:hypothetical protein
VKQDRVTTVVLVYLLTPVQAVAVVAQVVLAAVYLPLTSTAQQVLD